MGIEAYNLLLENLIPYGITETNGFDRLKMVICPGSGFTKKFRFMIDGKYEFTIMIENTPKVDQFGRVVGFTENCVKIVENIEEGNK